nr:MAG TPA: hypothetical protein [Caudoviricetes sp.]
MYHNLQKIYNTEYCILYIAKTIKAYNVSSNGLNL